MKLIKKLLAPAIVLIFVVVFFNTKVVYSRDSGSLRQYFLGGSCSRHDILLASALVGSPTNRVPNIETPFPMEIEVENETEEVPIHIYGFKYGCHGKSIPWEYATGYIGRIRPHSRIRINREPNFNLIAGAVSPGWASMSNPVSAVLDIRGLQTGGGVIENPASIFGCTIKNGLDPERVERAWRTGDYTGFIKGDVYDACEVNPVRIRIRRKPPKRWQSNSKTQLSNGAMNNRTNPQIIIKGGGVDFNHSIWADRIDRVGTPVDYSIIEIKEDGGRPREERIVGRGRVSQRLGEFMRDNSRFVDSNRSNENVGRTICHFMRYTPAHFNMSVLSTNTQTPSGNGAETFPACVYIPYNYELTPCAAIRGVSECGGRTIPREPGSSTPVEPTVDNPNGNTPSRPDTQWIITTWEVDGNDEDKPTPNDKIDNNDKNPCRTYDKAFRGTGSGSIARNCNSSERGTGKFDPGNKTKVGGDKHLVIPPDAPLGKRYCIGLSVSPYKLRENESKETQDKFVNNQWRHSAPICVIATKKPKLQIWGNGIYSKAGIKTSRSRYDGKGLFGSWVEYEAISAGKIDRFASESSREGSNLTFTNNNIQKGNWGQWNGATNIDNVITNINGRYPSSRDGVNIETAGASYGRYDGNGTPNIHTHIIRREGNLFLTGNIITRNPTTGNGVNKFQQNIIIVNGDLTISQDVTQIDAWLIVKGTITTCVPRNTGRVTQSFVNNDNCGKPLRVNGPVIAGNLNPWRTGASDYNSPNTPSEIFNQRPDIYLWAAHQGSARTKAITTYDKELPARY